MGQFFDDPKQKKSIDASTNQDKYEKELSSYCSAEYIERKEYQMILTTCLRHCLISASQNIAACFIVSSKRAGRIIIVCCNERLTHQ